MISAEPKKRIVLILSAVFSVVGFAAGIKIAQYFGEENRRDPAADKSTKEMQLLSQKNLLANASVVRSDRGWGIEFGSFNVLNESGETTHVCTVYENIELVYVADGMAVSGALPKMTVRGPCKTQNQNEQIEAFYLSKKDITRTPAADKIMTNPAQQLNLSFNNLSDSWPPMWVLHSIRFYNSDNRELAISSEEIRQSRTTPLVIEW